MNQLCMFGTELFHAFTRLLPYCNCSMVTRCSSDRPAMEQMVWAMFGLHPDNFSLEETFQELRSRYATDT